MLPKSSTSGRCLLGRYYSSTMYFKNVRIEIGEYSKEETSIYITDSI